MTIVVLGAGIDRSGKLSEDAKKRLKEAKRLHEKYKTPILLCGKYSFLYEKNPPPITEAEAMQKYLIVLGVSQENICLEKESQDTISNAYNAKVKYFIPRKESEAIIVTSDFHLERAEYIFFKIFGDSYKLHFLGIPTSLPCQSRAQIKERQRALTRKAGEILKDIRPGDHEAAKKKLLLSDYYREKRPSWVKDFTTRRKFC